MAINYDYILQVLQEKDVVSGDQVKAAFQHAEDSKFRMNVVEALIDLKFITDDKISSVIAAEYGLEIVDLSGFVIPKDIVDLISKDTAKEYHIVPVKFENNILTVAMSNPMEIDTIDSLRFVIKKNVEAVIAPRQQIEQLIINNYGSIDESVDSFLENIENSDQIGNITLEEETQKGVESSEDNEAPIIKLVSLMIMEAFKRRASDIHVEPLEKKFRVRYRIDGSLVEVDSPPKYLQPNILSRLKIMSRMDIAEKRMPQDGRIQIKIGGKYIDLRVSSIPTNHGESIVMRILDKSSIMIDFPALGLYGEDAEYVRRIITNPDGIFLVTGPTGSGKTTSLYAFLNSVNSPTKKIITVEDPVEYQLEGINQVQVNNLVGMTFAAALKAMIRQAPNIIMIGEIRDEETAEIAINAALTGHLVFSTLHTNDAPSAINRIVDIGVKPFLVASALQAVMAQRLVRRICTNCSQAYTPSDSELEDLGIKREDISGGELRRGKGCELCSNTGFKGRMGIFEIFSINEEIQNMIYKGATSYDIKKVARKYGMKTLREDGMRKVFNGMTTLDEIVSATIGD